MLENLLENAVYVPMENKILLIFTERRTKCQSFPNLYKYSAAMQDLAVLRTAKQAMAEGLLTQVGGQSMLHCTYPNPLWIADV